MELFIAMKRLQSSYCVKPTHFAMLARRFILSRFISLLSISVRKKSRSSSSGKRQALSLSALALLARHFHFWSTFRHFHFQHLHFWLDTFTFGALFDTFPFQTTESFGTF